MIRFSHSANSWQVTITKDGWANVTVEEARVFFDMRMPLWHQSQLIVI